MGSTAILTQNHTLVRRFSRLGAALLLAASLSMVGATAALADGPTCAETLGIAVHGQHIIGDYVTGVGGHELSWPPAGGVGAVTGGEGAAVPGGPGPGFHFVIGAAPGASFCNPQAQSPGFHIP